MFSLDDIFRRIGIQQNSSRGSGHTAPINYGHVLSNRGQSLRCLGDFIVMPCTKRDAISPYFQIKIVVMHYCA